MHGARWATEMTLGTARGWIKRGNYGAGAGQQQGRRQRHVELWSELVNTRTSGRKLNNLRNMERS